MLAALTPACGKAVRQTPHRHLARAPNAVAPSKTCYNHGVWLLLAACAPSTKPDDDSAPGRGAHDSTASYTDTGSDSATTTTSPCVDESGLDTGVAVSTFGGWIRAEEGVASGTVGYTLYSFPLSDIGCVLEGHITSTQSVAPCPDCIWSFDMSPVEGSLATGVCCEHFGWHDGQLDGQWDYEWGFSEYYAYPYNGYYIPLKDVVWVGTSNSWSLLSFNWPDRGLYLTYQYDNTVEFEVLYTSWPY